MSFNDRTKRIENQKNMTNPSDQDQRKLKSKKSNKDIYPDMNDKSKAIQSLVGGSRSDRKSERTDKDVKILRHSASVTPLIGNNSHAPRFEIYPNYTLVAKQSQASSLKMTSSALIKSRPDTIVRSNQQMPTIKPQYGQNGIQIISGTAPKFNRTMSSIIDQNRSMSTSYNGQFRPDSSVHKSGSNRQQISSQPLLKSQKRPISASTKPSYNINISTQNNDSSNRNTNRGSSNIIEEKPIVFYSLPRKTKDQCNGNGYGSTTRISSNPLYIHTGSSRKHKTSPIKIPKNYDSIVQDATDDNPINFSQALARAATNSPQIKRRSSSLLCSPNTRINPRFATKNTIDEIYTQKNRKDNIEKYKKVANEILRENLMLKFGENYSFLNLTRDNHLHSSTSSVSSTLSATDQQHSISSIPPDDIPLDIPTNDQRHLNSFHSNNLFHSTEHIKNLIEDEDSTEIVEDTVKSDSNRIEVVNCVHLSDEDNEDSDECDLENDRSSSESFASDSDGDIEHLKGKFIPLHEIERMDNDFVLENDTLQLPDHQHSQSFRIENTSLGSIVEVFVHKDSLQRAKNALMIVPTQGILSKRANDSLSSKKRRALFDPHILLLDACLEPDFNLVVELLPKILNISKSNVDGITALHNAVCSAEAKLVLYLLHNGANVNASDADGWTPLHCAACCNNKQISRILVENGASLFALTLSDYEIPSQKCNKANQDDIQCEEYLFCEQENLGVINDGIVYSLFEYLPQSVDELPLKPNKILKVIDTNPQGETDWFLAEDISQITNVPKRGFVAAAYVSCYPLTMSNI